MSLRVRPCELVTANAFVAQHHRHHQPVQGHRFSLAAWDGDRLVGVCVVGRPMARLGGHPLEVCEVTRLCTDGTSNACSALYGAAARVAREMGYARIQTYILDSETGASLKGSGWIHDHTTKGDTWFRNNPERIKRGSGKGEQQGQPTSIKQRWARTFRPVEEVKRWETGTERIIQAALL